jgi:hypothetical protein
VVNFQVHSGMEMCASVLAVGPKVLSKVELADMFKCLLSSVIRRRKEYRCKGRRQTFKQRSMTLSENELPCATQGSCCRMQSVRDQLAQSFSSKSKAYENCCKLSRALAGVSRLIRTVPASRHSSGIGLIIDVFTWQRFSVLIAFVQNV